jgi:hypothetical protein
MWHVDVWLHTVAQSVALFDRLFTARQNHKRYTQRKVLDQYILQVSVRHRQRHTMHESKAPLKCRAYFVTLALCILCTGIKLPFPEIRNGEEIGEEINYHKLQKL